MTSQSSDLVALVYAALDDPGGWTRFLQAFVTAMNTTQAVFSLTHSDHWEWSLSAYVGLEEKSIRQYAEVWAIHDPWMAHSDMGKASPGRVVPSQELCPNDELEQLEIYRQFLKPLGFHYGGGVLLDAQPTLTAFMSTSRPKSRGPLNADELDLWQGLVPHLQHAIRLHGERARLRAERDVLLRYFDDTGAGLLLVDRAGTVLVSNARARAVLDEGDGLRLETGGRLRAANRQDDALLSMALACFGVSESHTVKTSKVAVRRGIDRPPLLVVLSPASKEAASNVSPREPATLLYLFDPQIPTEFDPAPLQSMFDLTPAEAGFACRLAGGESVDEAANALGVSVHTTRTHLKRTLHKTNTRRQAELVSLVLRVARK